MNADTLSRRTLVDQTAGHLREKIREGRWGEFLPSERRLSAMLGVSRPTAAAAVARLIGEGLLIHNGARRAIGIGTPASRFRGREKSLRMTLLLRWPLENVAPSTQRLVMRALALLKSLGHTADYVAIPAGRKQGGAGHLPKLVRKHVSDAWIVVDGTKETLEWFAVKKIPVFGLGGAATDIPVAKSFPMDSRPMIKTITGRLVALGHRSIVLICFKTAREPAPGRLVAAFREALAEAGIRPGEYNVPDWEESPQGLGALLESLFRLTPPTALICHNPGTTVATYTFLAQRGLRTPRDVSLVSLADKDALAYWASLGVRCAHVETGVTACCDRLRRWTENLTKGREDTRQHYGRARLDEGDTIGPAPRR